MKASVIFMKWARSPQNESKVPFKPILPMALRNRVTGKNSKSTEQGCLQQVTLLLSCLEKNNYENSKCTLEAKELANCYDTHRKNKKFAKEQSLKGVLTPGSKNLTYLQINQILRKNPQV